MKTIGLIGGMSWESSIEYYRIINETAKAKTENALKRKDEGPLQILIDMVPSNIFLALSSNGLMLQIIFFAANNTKFQFHLSSSS